MIIDAHNHVEWHGYRADDLVANMDEYGIDKTWVCTWECPPREISLEGYAKAFAPDRIGMPLRDMVDAVDKYPERLVPFYAPDPRDPSAAEKLESAVDMYGVRGYGELKVRIMADDPDALMMYRLCGEMGLPVVIHIDITFPVGGVPKSRQTWYCYDINRLENALKLCPGTNFIGHAPGFWREISGENTVEEAYPGGPVKPGGKLPELLDRYGNLYCDLSAGSGYNAIDRDREHGKEFLTKYQDRVLYGRDYTDNRHQEMLREMGLPGEALEKILGGNALNLVPLD
ncbi:MAG: amidohydrolase family protein [Planctomycetes bacterium]|nr:amidohydrolase family protein [Planctomycetota bacterium]